MFVQVQLSLAWQAINSALCSDIERAPDPSMMEICIDAKGAQRRGYMEEFAGEVTSGPSCALGVLIKVEKNCGVGTGLLRAHTVSEDMSDDGS